MLVRNLVRHSARGPARDARRASRGQSLVEAAIAMPVLIALSLGVADAGRVFAMRETVTNAARQALRVAVSAAEETGSSGLHPGESACNHAGATFTGTASATAHLPAAAGDSAFVADVARAAWIESSSDGTPSGSRLSGNSAATVLTISWHCAGGHVVTNSSATSSDPTSSGSAAVTVTVRAQFDPITPLVGHLLPNTAVSTVLSGRAEY